jgi:hypothetical protein
MSYRVPLVKPSPLQVRALQMVFPMINISKLSETYFGSMLHFLDRALHTQLLDRWNSLEGIAVCRSLRIYKTLKKIIIIQSLILITMWHHFFILQGKSS